MSVVHEQFDDAQQQFDAAKLGMWTFLATEILLFGTLFCVYFFYRFTFPHGFIAASRHTDAMLGTIETGALLTSSLTMALAIRAIRMRQRHVVPCLILATILCGVAFIGIHGYEYVHEWHEHLFPGERFDVELGSQPGAQMFFFLYYAMTGLHGLHVLIGIATLSILGVLTLRGHYSSAFYTPVELGGLYWHLVDIVWIFLFPLFYLVARS